MKLKDMEKAALRDIINNNTSSITKLKVLIKKTLKEDRKNSTLENLLEETKEDLLWINYRILKTLTN